MAPSLPLNPNLLQGNKGDTGPMGPVSFAAVIETLKESFDRSLFLHFPDPAVQTQAQLMLVTLAAQIRESFVVSEVDLDQVWEIIRNGGLDRLIDFLHTLLSDVLLYHPTARVSDLTLMLSRAIDAASRISPNRDPDFEESLTDQKTLNDVLNANPWYLTILLLKRTGKLNLTRSASPAPSVPSTTQMPTFDELLVMIKEQLESKAENQMVAS